MARLSAAEDTATVEDSEAAFAVASDVEAAVASEVEAAVASEVEAGVESETGADFDNRLDDDDVFRPLFRLAVEIFSFFFRFLFSSLNMRRVMASSSSELEVS